MMDRIVIATKRFFARSSWIRGAMKRLWPCGRAVRVKQGPATHMRLRVPALSGGATYGAGKYENDEIDLCLSLASSAQIAWFCDVGAHVGYYSLAVDRAMHGECFIHAFEPAAEAFVCLASNLAHNCEGPFRAYHEAVADVSGVGLFDGEEGQVASGLQAHRPQTYGNVGGYVTAVQVVSLDEVLAETTVGRGLIKVDVEGAEAAVLDGATRILEQLRPTWVVECHSAEMQIGVLERLACANYTCYHLPTGPQAAFSHVVAVPAEDHDAFADLFSELSDAGRPDSAHQA